MYYRITVLNWDKYQGPAKRYQSTHWFRLECNLIYHPLIDILSAAEFRAFVLLLSLVAQKQKGQLGILVGQRALKHALLLTRTVHLKALLKKLSDLTIVKFIEETSLSHSASTEHAPCTNSATKRNETNERYDTQKQDQQHPGDFFSELVGRYARPPLNARTSLMLSSSQQAQANKLWSFHPETQYWEKVMVVAASSSFLCGKCPNPNGKAFRFTLGFLLKSETHVKIMAGEYHDKPLTQVVKREWIYPDAK